ISTRTLPFWASLTGCCLVAVAISAPAPSSREVFKPETLACRLFLRQRLDLGQHLFHPATNFFAFLAQADHFAAHGLDFLLAFFELGPQTLRIAFGRGAGFAR